MSETTARIRWSDDRGFGCVGTIGPFMFQIVRVYLGPKWMLTADGMGRAFKDREPRSDDMDELKALAEEWLEEFVTSLGAIFPGALRSEVESMRGDKYQLAGDHEESGHDWQTERAFGAVEALDWMLATIDRMAANPAPAGEKE